MMRFTLRACVALPFLLALVLLTIVQTRAQDATVYAVLFFSPSCPHCHEVMDNDLPPLLAQYGDQLQILAVDTTTASGSELYGAMLEAYAVPQQRVGVPALLIDGQHLVGSGEIPEQLPGIVAAGLAQGGIGLPFIPGLAWPTVPTYGVFLTSGDSAETLADLSTTQSATTPPAAEPEVATTDTAGFALAWIILIGMIATLIFVMYRIVQTRPNWEKLPMITSWLIPLLVVVGLGVAAYLAYVEITHVEAVCGPVGECNLVQSSSYATIAGMPVAVLGLISYLSIGVLWLIQRVRDDLVAVWSRGALLALAVAGVLFSIYLTLVELFAIHAVCAWCLTSAVVTTALLLVIVLSLTQTPQKKARYEPRPKRA
jgi:uncharacterized membrane protein